MSNNPIDAKIDAKEVGPEGNGFTSRRAMGYGLYGLAAALALVAAIVWPFDRILSDVLHISGLNQRFLLLLPAAQAVNLFGKADILLLLGFVLMIRRRKQVAVTACIAMLLAGLIVTPMKLVFERQRPDGRDARSFPSGDAAAITAFLVPIASAFPALRPVALASVAAVGAARVAVGLHFPSDILTGIAIGIFAGAVVLSLKISLKPRIRRLLLRRSWLAIALGLLILIRLPMASGSNIREFLPIFGPAVALLAITPFVRARLRTWPAFSLAVAGTIGAAERGTLAPRDLAWLARGRWFFGMIGFLTGTALVAGLWFVPAFGLSLPGFELAWPGLARSFASLGCVLLVMTAIALREHSVGRYRSTVGVLVAGVAALIFTIVVIALPTVVRFKVSKPLAEAIRAQTAADVPVAELDTDEPSLIFYLGRRHLKSLENDADVITWAKESQPGVLIISRKALARIEAGNGPLGLKEIAAARGFNYSKGRWIDLVALGRRLSAGVDHG